MLCAGQVRLFPAVAVIVAACSFSGRAAAAERKPAADTVPPVLVSKGVQAPRWNSIAQLSQFAAKGDPAACLELADRYLEGDSVPRDPRRAAELFQQAGQGGLSNAWFRLGKIFHDGLIGAPDYGRALEYFSLAARAGVAEAQHNIGAMLVSARGVKRDYVEGLAWLIVATQAGMDASDEAQVRTRLARRPAEIKAAEARAVELAGNLAGATVRAKTAASLPAPAANPRENAVRPPAVPVPERNVPVAVPIIRPPASVRLDPPVTPEIRSIPPLPERR